MSLSDSLGGLFAKPYEQIQRRLRVEWTRRHPD
jgi:hypothetical protein